MTTTSLRAWLALYAAPGDDDCHALLALLRRAFPTLIGDVGDAGAGADWRVIVRVLEQFYEMPLGVDAMRLGADGGAVSAQLLEWTIGAVVQSAQKAAFVRDILMLSDAVQADLMAAIERVMAQQQAAASATVAETAELHSEAQQQGSSPSKTPLHLSRTAALERAKRENEFLKEENIRVTQDLQETTRTLQEAAAENSALTETIQELRLQLEVDVLRRERAVRAMFDERVHALERDLAAANTKLQTQAAIASELSELRDEVDLLRPAAAKVAKMEAAVAKYKAKVEELACVQEKLRRFEGSNAELMAKTLSLEAQVSKSVALQRKLADAKEVNTAVEFRVSELQAQLLRQESELVRTRSEWEAAQSSLLEANALNAQLQQTVSEQLKPGALAISAPADALAGGISEFNPELMQKLTRLEYENEALRRQADGETTERIDALLDEISDLRRLKKSFEARYFDTEQQLQEKCGELELARQRIATSDDALRSLESHVERLTRDAADQSCVIELLRRNVAELQERSLALEEDVNSHEVERQVAADERCRLEACVLQLESRYSEQADTLSTRNTEVEALRDAAEQLRVRVKEMEIFGAELDGCKQMLETRVHVLESENANLVTRKSELEDRVSALDGAVATAKADLENRASEVAALSLLFSSTFETKEELDRSLQQSLEQVDALTKVVNAKAAHIEELKSRMREMSEEHSTAIANMEVASSEERRRLQMEMDAYKQEHSMSNAERDVVERELRDEISRLVTTSRDELAKFSEHARLLGEEINQRDGSLDAMRMQFNEREETLKGTIRSQLDSNQQLMEANQALKSELRKKTTTVAQLEHSVTRLESKVLVFEKERAHLSIQEDRKREVEEEEASFSSQLATQVGLVGAELEQLQKEHAELRRQMRSCECSNSSSTGHHHLAGADSTKRSYLDRIRQLEQSKQEEENKRRELLLVNTKLIQEQKQAQKKYVAMVDEMQQVREKMNSWLLRDERRRKENEVVRHKLAALESTHRQLLRAQSAGGTQVNAAKPSEAVGSGYEESVPERSLDALPATASEIDVHTTADKADASETITASTITDTIRSSPGGHGAAAGHNKCLTTEVSPIGCVDENKSPNVRISRKRKLDAVVKHTAASDSREQPIDDALLQSSSIAITPTAVKTAPVNQPVKRRMPMFSANRLHSDLPASADAEKPSECKQQ